MHNCLQESTEKGGIRPPKTAVDPRLNGWYKNAVLSDMIICCYLSLFIVENRSSMLFLTVPESCYCLFILKIAHIKPLDLQDLLVNQVQDGFDSAIKFVPNI